MTHAVASDNVRLYFETAGSGTPIVFVHEFAGNYWSWEPQVSYFARRHLCVAYAARGYPPSDVPDSVESYSQAQAADDIIAVMDALGLERAHIVGLSMGAFACLHAGLRHRDRLMSIVVAGLGYGAEKAREAEFKQAAEEAAKTIEQRGAKDFAAVYAESAARVQFQNKDPRGWRVFADRLAGHDPKGASNTMRGVQARRPSLYDLEPELSGLDTPILVVAGDEDDQCLAPGIFLKRTMPRAGLAVLAKSGHTLNLEEPAAFNRLVADFVAMVEAGRWEARDPRADPQQILRSD